jgi:sugar lactone lactonase YvrE
MNATQPRVLLDGLQLPESPRWRDGKLWFVDMFNHQVLTLDESNRREVIASFDDQTSGLGFLLDGTPLVDLKYQCKVMRIEADGHTSVHADLTVYGPKHLNDMVLDRAGRAYVDTNSYLPGHETPPEVRDRITVVYPDGTSKIVAEDLMGPNGLAISEDGTTLIVAEIRGRYISVFDIDASDGSLGNKRRFADTGPDRRPDGLCLDAEGAVWYACPDTGEFVRIRPGGEVAQIVHSGVGNFALACCLGGPQRQTLYMMSADTSWKQVVEHKTTGGFIEAVEVAVPGAGIP